MFRNVIMMFLPILLFTADDPSEEGSLSGLGTAAGSHRPRQDRLSAIGCANRAGRGSPDRGTTLSSFVVGTDLIDLLATAARRIRNGKMPDRFFDYEDTATAQSIGEALTWSPSTAYIPQRG